jgi:hypothetical protein
MISRSEVILPVLGLLVVGCAEAAAQSQQSGMDFSREIVLEPADEPGWAVFIPEALLQEAERAHAPALEEYGELIRRLEREARFMLEGAGGTCLERPYDPDGLKPSQDALPLVGLLRSARVVSEATVVDVVTGWGYGLVRTLVWVQIEEILRCAPEGDEEGGEEGVRTLVPGDVLALVSEQGRLTVDRITLCSEVDRITLPPVGSKVLITGYPVTPDSPVVGPGEHIFRVFKGVVLPQPYEDLAPRVPLPYATVREAVGPSAPACGGLR